jgi:2-polyprenyl-3-methyl-5-hydroxy-6-metoxy-1,4-benzoquinol methylase
MKYDIADRTYRNAGNPAVVALVDRETRVVLDVGCGAGDNAALLLDRDPEKQIYGVTGSESEAQLATRYMQHCWVTDIEAELPAAIGTRQYDCVVFSHVLEHTRDPASVLARFTQYLRPGGSVIIAVPNVVMWRQRWDFIRGRFEYTEGGTLDQTHLRFFSYRTAETYLFANAPEMQIVHKSAPGSVPLWILRRRVLPKRVSEQIDAWASRIWPNLFGSQILIKGMKPHPAEVPLSPNQTTGFSRFGSIERC